MPRPRRLSYGRTFTGEDGKQRTLRHLQSAPPDARTYPSPNDLDPLIVDLPYSDPSRTKAAPAGTRSFDAESPTPERNTPVRSFHNPATGLPVTLDHRNRVLRSGYTEEHFIPQYEPYVPPAQRPGVVRRAQSTLRQTLTQRAKRGTL